MNIQMIDDSKRQRQFRVFQVELAAARKLARKLQQLLWKEMPHFDAPGFEFAIAYVLFLRVERTFTSIRTLARLRLVDDALALVRVMVEKIINAEYILLTGTETALDYLKYHAFREWRDLEELQSVGASLAPDYTTEYLEQLRKSHDKAKTRTFPDGSQRNRFGRGHDWIDIGLSKRAEKIDKILAERLSISSFNSTQILYHFTYKKAAAYLHGMWESVARSLETGQSKKDADVNGMIEMNVGVRIKDKDLRIAIKALGMANLAAISAILFIGKVFKKKKHLDWIKNFKDEYTDDRKQASKKL